jgi:hypothetical protein
VAATIHFQRAVWFISKLILLLWTAGCLFASVSGCGNATPTIKDRASVSGIVTYDDKPLPAGTIEFESASGTVSTAIPISKGGVFSTDRAPIGKNLVTVDTTSIRYGNPAAYVPIPAKYNNPRTSELIIEVKPGSNEKVEFNLKD